MSKTDTASLESLAAEAGVDVAEAKASLAALDAQFGGETGLIPDGALMAWTHTHFDQERLRKMAFLIGKKWEWDIDEGDDRKWELSPDAGKIKAEMNAKKAAKK